MMGMEVRKIKIEDLVESEWNVNEMDDKTFNRLVDELETTGLIDPIQVVPIDGGKYRVIGGNHRLKAAKVLGWTEIDCVVLTDARFMDEDLQKFISLRLNLIRGKINPEKFVNLYQEMVEKYGKEALSDLMGFTDTDAFNKLVATVEKNVKNVLPPSISKKFEKAKKDIKTLDDLGNILNKLYSEYGHTIEKNYMFFVYGGKEHVMIECDKALWETVHRLLDVVAETKYTATELLNSAIKEYLLKHGY